jgi:hypothetical protein
MESNINKYKLEQNGKEYALTTSIIGNRLRLSCKNVVNQYIKFTRDFTLEDLKQLDKIFNVISNPYQALKYFDNILKNEKVKVLEESDKIKLVFYLESTEDSHQMGFPLTGEIMTSTTTNEYITTTNAEATQNYETYDTTAFQNIDTTTQYNTEFDINANANNYIQNIETTNNIIDTGVDYAQYQENVNTYNTYNTSNEYNEYQTSTPIENYQVNETTQNYEEYTTTTNIPQTTSESIPYITPVIEDTSNQFIQTTTTTETKNVNYSDERINKLEGDTNYLKNEHQEFQNKLNTLTGQLNTYQNKISLMEQNNSNNEIQALKAENQLIKQQLQELNNLRNEAAEARYLRTQLSELDPLRKKAAEADMLKAQLSELNSLKIKFEELKKSKAQLNEMNNLRNEFEEINALRKQLNELNNMRNKALEDNNLKERINELEQIKSQYEQELNFLRNSHTNALIEMNNKLRRSSGMDSKQLYFEDKPLQIAVKGDIIHSAQELELLTRQINKSNRKITLNLLYKATADSDKAEAFHKKCDRAQSTLVLIETDKGRRFGGFTTKSWAGECQEKKDEEAFVFSLDKMMIYEIIPDELAIGCYPKFGPIFLGCQIRIYDNAFIKGGTTFEKGMNYNTEEDYELTGGDREFMVREIEVYEVIPS